jgi:mono/diheme cytochrome c family protein
MPVRVLALVLLVLWASPARAGDEAQLRRGELLFRAADCTFCHTDSKGGGAPLAGGRPISTRFGVIFSPNITPDPKTGIGAWSKAEFDRALRQGIGRDGQYLFPVFPYPAFTKMSDADIGDLYAYLMSRPAVVQADKPDAFRIPFRWRFLQRFWRLLFFRPGPLPPVAGQSAAWNRGRYLAEAVVHCQECHTPRNFLGGLVTSRAYAGNPHAPDGMKVPNITSDPETGIGKWGADDVAALLKTGQTPDMDFVGSGMAEVVKGTGALSDADRNAIATYIKSIPPIRTAKKPAS